MPGEFPDSYPPKRPEDTPDAAQFTAEPLASHPYGFDLGEPTAEVVTQDVLAITGLPPVPGELADTAMVAPKAYGEPTEEDVLGVDFDPDATQELTDAQEDA